MTRLTLLQGGLDNMHAELHAEVVVSRAERATFASRVRVLSRQAMARMAAGHIAAAGSALVTLSELAEQEAVRSLSMEPPCSCGPAEEEQVAA